jgi:hypothetical protein
MAEAEEAASRPAARRREMFLLFMMCGCLWLGEELRKKVFGGGASQNSFELLIFRGDGSRNRTTEDLPLVFAQFIFFAYRPRSPAPSRGATPAGRGTSPSRRRDAGRCSVDRIVRIIFVFAGFSVPSWGAAQHG